MSQLNITTDLEKIQKLAGKLFGHSVSDVYEETGEQGNSGAAVHYFHCRVEGRPAQFVAKHATLLERQILDLLRSQKQAVPDCVYEFKVDGRDWLIMEHLDEIPYGDNEQLSWAKKLGPALAKVHATNYGTRPAWLPDMPRHNPLSAVNANEWFTEFDTLLATNHVFTKQFGPLKEGLLKSWQEFEHLVMEEVAHPERLTLISTDLTPSHWRQRKGQPVLIDWEQSCYGPLYLDLPNMLNEKTVGPYYRALVENGVNISPRKFAANFSLMSRYLGFRYMTVGLEYWQNRLASNLPDNYWETSGERFFQKCLHIAQHGYPEPEL